MGRLAKCILYIIYSDKTSLQFRFNIHNVPFPLERESTEYKILCITCRVDVSVLISRDTIESVVDYPLLLRSTELIENHV